MSGIAWLISSIASEVFLGFEPSFVVSVAAARLKNILLYALVFFILLLNPPHVNVVVYWSLARSVITPVK